MRTLQSYVYRHSQDKFVEVDEVVTSQSDENSDSSECTIVERGASAPAHVRAVQHHSHHEEWRHIPVEHKGGGFGK